MPLIPIKNVPDEELLLFHSRRDSVLAHFYEPAPGVFIAESAKVALRALEAGYEPVSLLVEEAQLAHDAAGLLELLPDLNVYVAEHERFQEIAGYPMTRGVLCAFRRKPFLSAADVLTPLLQESKDTSGKTLPPTIQGTPDAEGHLPKTHIRAAVLENVVNPANTGSIFRNAAALGIDAIILGNGTCDPLSRRCLRVSMGTVFQVPWAKDPHWMSALKALGFETAAMALSDRSVPLTHPALKEAGRLALVLGNEGDGLPPEVIGQCSFTVRIPMYHGVDSLNVSAASAIAFWELR